MMTADIDELARKYRLDEDFFADYELLEPLGQGGIAEVVKGRQKGLDRFVAIKFLSHKFTDDEEAMTRFVREAKLLARLDHPNVVRVIQFGHRAESPYLVMEFVEGETLRDRLKRSGALRHVEALDIMAGICSALQAAHELGVIHRDVKADNVLLSADGKVKLADFGLAKSTKGLPDDQTATGVICGTPAYMSPEQCHGLELDTRTDIYSAGVVLFQMLTGKVPFEDDSTLKVLQHHVHTPVPELQSIVPFIRLELNELVQQALRKEPDERYRTAAAFLAAIERTRERMIKSKLADTGSHETGSRKRLAEGDETQPVTLPVGDEPWWRSNGALAAAMFLALFVLAAVVMQPMPAPGRRPVPAITRPDDGVNVNGQPGDEATTGTPPALTATDELLEQVAEHRSRLVRWRGIEDTEGRALVAALVTYAQRTDDGTVAAAARSALVDLVLNASPGGLPIDVAADGAVALAERGDDLASTTLLTWLPRLRPSRRIQALQAVQRGSNFRRLSGEPARAALAERCRALLQDPPVKTCSSGQRHLVTTLLEQIAEGETAAVEER